MVFTALVPLYRRLAQTLPADERLQPQKSETVRSQSGFFATKSASASMYSAKAPPKPLTPPAQPYTSSPGLKLLDPWTGYKSDLVVL